MAQNKGRGHQQTAPRAGSPGDQDAAVPGCCWHLELMHLGTALPSWLFGRKTLLQQAARPELLRVVARDVERPCGMSCSSGHGVQSPSLVPPSLLASHLRSPQVVNLPPRLPLPFQNRGTPEQIPSSSCSLAVFPSLSLTNSNQMIVTSTMQLQTRTEDPEKRFGETGTQLHGERSDLFIFFFLET